MGPRGRGLGAEGEAVLLARATDGKMKLTCEVRPPTPLPPSEPPALPSGDPAPGALISAHSIAKSRTPLASIQVTAKDHIKFQIALSDMLKMELDGLKKRDRTREKDMKKHEKDRHHHKAN